MDRTVRIISKLATGKILCRLAIALLLLAAIHGTTSLAYGFSSENATVELVVATSQTEIDITNTSTRNFGTWSFDGKTYTIYNDVTVVGDKDNGNPLIFDLKNNAEVTWRAKYNGTSNSTSFCLVEIKGSGSFEIRDNGNIALNGAGTAVRSENGIELIISSSDGIRADGGNSICTALRSAGTVNINSGTSEVMASSDVGCTAIYAEGDLNINAGSVYTSPATNSEGVAIRGEGDLNISVSGSAAVNGGGGAIIAKEANITVGDDAKIMSTCMLSYVNNELLGNAITAKDVTVKDFAKISALNGAAIFLSGKLNIEGGALFALGDGIGGAYFNIGKGESGERYDMFNVVFRTDSLDIYPEINYADDIDISSCISGDGVVIAWDFNAWHDLNNLGFRYSDGEKTDLFVCPIGGFDYGWGTSGSGDIVTYSNKTNIGNFYVDYASLPTKPLKPNPKQDSKNDPNPASTQYNVLGDFGKYTGSGIISGTVDADANEFVRLTLNGKEVDSANYVKKSGSTIITLNESYLKTFKDGTYNFSAEFINGYANLTLVVALNNGAGSPNTGDNLSIGIMISLIVLSGAIILFRRKIVRF